MDNFLYYILKSSVCICCLFLVFRVLMSKEACFAVNRVALLAIIAGSILIPVIYSPQLHTPVRVELIPEFSSNHIQFENLTGANYGNSIQVSKGIEQTGNMINLSLIMVLKYIYLSGLLIAFVLLLRNIITVLLLLRKSTILKTDGYRVMLSERNVPSFAFAHSIIISRNDYETYGSSILPHEQAHIRLNHFYDLMFLELVKVFHWFNPAVYGIIRHLKEIHEFQADDYAIHSGIEASQYKLLLIEKCVGPKRFALANSFNHCQIKKRIIMMNKQKNSKAWRWKVATFLPILAFLLMAFGKGNAELSKNPVLTGKKNEQINAASSASQSQQQSTDRVIHIKSGGNYIGNKLCTLEEIIKKGKEWQSAGNDFIHLQIDESIPYSRVDEVMSALENANVYHITQSFSGSDEIIYFSGDVTSMAKFKEGKWDDWFNDELDKLLDDKSKSLEYKIRFTFIIDKNGKVRDGHITKPCEYSEINAAYEKVLAQIPDWQPARRSGSPVNVYYSAIRSQRINKN